MLAGWGGYSPGEAIQLGDCYLCTNTYHLHYTLQKCPSGLAAEVYASRYHGDCRPSESSHTAAWFCCLPLVSLSSSDKTGKSTETGDFTQTGDCVQALIACDVLSVADRPVAGESVDRVKAI